ncbi:MAG: type II secretion system F family protein [bacterium]
MPEPPDEVRTIIKRIPQRKRRGGGLSIRQLLFAVLVFSVAFAFIRLFENHLEILVGLTVAFTITLLFGLSVSLMRRRAGMQEAFLELVAISRRAGLPLGLGLMSFAPQSGWSYGRRLVRLAGNLDSGMSLSDGVAVTSGVLPLEQRVHFRVAEFNGSRADSLQRIADQRFRRIDALKPLIDSIVYYLIVIWQISLITIFLSYFIAPKMQAILENFGIAQPRITEVFLQLTSGTAFAFVSYPLLGFLLFASFRAIPLFVGFLIIYITYLFNSGRGMGFSGRFVPWMTTSERAGLLRGMADTIRCENPLDECLQIFADWSMRGLVRRRCIKARRAMLAGTDWIQSLVDEGIVKNQERALINSATEAGRASWALEQLADAIESRQWYRYQLINQFISPAMTFFVAGIVLLTAFAFFSPLVQIIKTLAS